MIGVMTLLCSVPRISTFLWMDLEAGMKVGSLVLASTSLPSALWSHTLVWPGVLLTIGSFATLAYLLAFASIQWKRNDDLMIPGLVVSAFSSLVLPVVAVMALLPPLASPWCGSWCNDWNHQGVERALYAGLTMVEAALTAYYWVGLKSLCDRYREERGVHAIASWARGNEERRHLSNMSMPVTSI